MNLDNAYLIDRFESDEPPIYIYMYELVFKLIDCEVCITVNDALIPTPFNFSLWVPTTERKLVNPVDPPILDLTEHNKQIFFENVEEIRLLYGEAVMLNALTEVSENVYEITIFDYRKGYNYLNSEKYVNHWSVYNHNIPDEHSQTLGRFFKEVRS